ncbi:DNA repair protein RAD51 homolog 3-like isoform X2 [Halichondria panicea]|uniref:DNA repair protein RAD51 homolog 3-like isoform X2 n=1 Tax=Halichondria panicea TaxID=6063 RepID=UPI00312B5A9F
MQSTLTLRSLPLAITHISKLSAAGFETVGDLRDVGIIDLSKETGLSHSEALEVLRVARETSACVGGVGVSALELLRSEVEAAHVVTFSSQVDSMLGGGVPVGKITEICGAPGLGKTQLSMQVAVDVAIPEVFGGLGGEAIYIDTEGSFVVERVVDMAKAAVAHLTTVAQSNHDQDMEAGLSGFTLEGVLSGIHYYRCHDYIELVALVNLLPDIINQHPKVKMVVVDSIASPFRYGFQDMGLRNRILSGLSQNLIQLAVTKHIAVVLTNQMTTKISEGSNKTAQLAPALGDSWGHVATVRVVLYWSGGVRYAWLLKSPNSREQTVAFQITVR